MNGAFYIGAIGLDAQQRALEVIANNIANINTVGFKRSAVRFSEMMAPSVSDALDAEPTTTYRGESLSGVAIDATRRVWTQGELRETRHPLDIAINGTGFLELMGANGRSLLWRGGTLKVNDDGTLAVADGTPLRAMISVPQNASALSIGRDGVISATTDGEEASEVLGQLELVMVKDPDSLIDIGGGYYEVPDASGTFTVQPGEEGGGTLVQGAVETANVRLTDEMTALLLTQRAFAANAQVVQAGDQLMSIINNLRR